MRRWDLLVEGHIRDCESRGLSQSVILGRRRELERWGNWLKRRKPKPSVEQIDTDLILAYIRSRTAFHSKATVCGIMSHMRNFGEYLAQESVWLQNPLRWLQSPKIDIRSHLPKRINQEELQKLWQEAAQAREEYSRHLWLAVLVILYGTGLRRGELERLNVSDWDREAGVLKIDGQKTNMERIIPVSERVAQCLETYLPHRQNILLKTAGTSQENALFVGKNGKRLRAEKLSIGVQRLVKRAGISKITLHQFRHSCASDLMSAGVGIVEVQKYLGHAALDTTIRYTHVASPERKRAMELHPINTILETPYGTSLSA